MFRNYLPAYDYGGSEGHDFKLMTYVNRYGHYDVADIAVTFKPWVDNIAVILFKCTTLGDDVF